MPTDPTPAAMEKAREIARFHAAPTANQPSLTYAIARAIDEARRVPDGHVREGVTDRKVLDAYYNMVGEMLKLPVLDEHHRLIRVRIEAARERGGG